MCEAVEGYDIRHELVGSPFPLRCLPVFLKGKVNDATESVRKTSQIITPKEC